MNRFVAKTAFAIMAIVLMIGQVQAQFTTTFAKNINPGQQNGLYYALPQTMLKIDFVIEETQLEKGPLSDYAHNYLDMLDPVEYKSMEYKLLAVKMTTVATPDPNALFFVTLNSVRGGSNIQLDIMPNGIIRSIGMSSLWGEEKILESPELVENEVIGEVATDAGFLGLMSAGKTNAQLAKEAADKIEEIRKAKFYLISGDVEMASNPETFNAMYQKLDAMEKEYMSLLIGNRVSKKVVRTVYVVPNKEVTTQTVAKFSETDGLTVGTEGSGKMITVQTLSMNTTAAINAPSQSAVESMNYENKVFYRVPEMANVKVMLDGKTLVEDRLIVNQLGALLMAPMQNTLLKYDTKTGQIVNLRL